MEDATRVESPDARIVALLRDGQPVFGIFSGDHTPESGAAMAEVRETDFVFYSLESGPFDLPAMGAYADAMTEAAGDRGARPLMLRIPPIRDGEGEARSRTADALAAGVAGIVFPHVESATDAAVAVSAIGASGWPTRPDGAHVNMLIVEDRIGVENVGAIAGTEGVSVVFAGPGDLRRAYDGDMEAVEAAIQTVLAACTEADVPCGITAGVDDIAERLGQGFRVIIVTQPEALSAGRAAAGRTDLD
ncbi:MAG: aldolase/citrate lyase family protein [Gemmatimonadetes bacterium]|nr:aldolase/citrate lyase family protein [Gemmatimonadota bacterium]